MTRAQDLLIITNAHHVGDGKRVPSRFLADIDLPD